MRPLLATLSPAGARARLSVLIFHRVLAQPDPLFPDEVDTTRFDTICGWLARWFNVLPLDEAVRRLSEGRLPARAAAITFDDGYADNHELALPILQRHGLNAAFFIATGFIGDGCMWNDVVIESLRRCRDDQVDTDGIDGLGFGRLPLRGVADRQAAIARVIGAAKYLPVPRRLVLVDRLRERAGLAAMPRPMMGAEQVRALRHAGMVIGAHTINHPILARTDRDTARAEMRSSRDWLQDVLQEPVDLFAYPNGRPDTDYCNDDAALAREVGFSAAFSTAWGAAAQGDDLFQLPRFTPWDRSRGRFGLRLARNLWQPRARLALSPRAAA